MAEKQKVFDFHVHIFPQKIALKAATNIGAFYDIPMAYDGSVEALAGVVERSGVNKCLIHSVATVPAQAEHINSFIAEEVKNSGGKYIGFCSVHPDMEEKALETEITRSVNELGLLGIKLHPDFQKFNIDDKNAYKLYEIAESMKLPILFHTGDKRWHYSSPDRLARVLKRFPKLIAIGAHFGGWSEWDEGERYLADCENVYVDSSSSFYDITPEKAMEYIRAFGAERVLFGSDYPMWDQSSEIAFYDKLSLTDEERGRIFWLNGHKLLGLEP